LRLGYFYLKILKVNNTCKKSSCFARGTFVRLVAE
jgi:hypothetical protein